jgi:endoglucanase
MQLKRSQTFRVPVLALMWLVMGFSLSVARAADAPTFLHTDGRDIKNERGEKVLLRGVGLGNWLLPEGYMWKFGNQADRPRRIEKLVSDLIGPDKADRFWSEYRKNYVADADIQRIAELGYNSVRPALNARLFMTDDGQLKNEGFDLLDNLVKRCKAHGIYVIIDMHAAPGGQTGQNIDDSANDSPELFIQTKYQDQFVDLWKAIAQRYKNEPTVAGYDLLNEPLPERTGAAPKYKSLLEPLYKRTTTAIREIDRKHMIIVEGCNWANDWSVFTGPFDKNLVYQFHYYCWDTPANVKSIQQYLDIGKKFNAPIWVGETGERDAPIYWATTEYFEVNNIGWAFWPWKKMGAVNAPYSIKLPREWQQIMVYSNGGGPKPSAEVAQQAFDELLVNLRLENCDYFPAIVNSMLRRAPARIEGENYGRQGADISYHVEDSTNLSKFYRKDEPVKITANNRGRRQSEQFITLKTGEWTAYTIDGGAAAKYAITVRVRAQDGPAEAQLEVNDHILDAPITQTAWTEIKLGPAALNRGPNHLKWVVKHGTVDLDWLDVTEEGNQTAKSDGPAPGPNN